jgi:hypothetical protein
MPRLSESRRGVSAGGAVLGTIVLIIGILGLLLTTSSSFFGMSVDLGAVWSNVIAWGFLVVGLFVAVVCWWKL